MFAPTASLYATASALHNVPLPLQRRQHGFRQLHSIRTALGVKYSDKRPRIKRPARHVIDGQTRVRKREAVCAQLEIAGLQSGREANMLVVHRYPHERGSPSLAPLVGAARVAVNVPVAATVHRVLQRSPRFGAAVFDGGQNQSLQRLCILELSARATLRGLSFPEALLKAFTASSTRFFKEAASSPTDFL